MANFNKVILIGNLTRDPEMRYLPSQTPVVEIGLAVNRRWKGSDGQQKEETCFIDCVSFGKQAEVLNQYMSKGRPIMVEGRLQLDTWEGKDGSRRSKHKVVIEQFQFLGGGQGSGQGSGQGGGQAAPRQQQQQPPSQSQDNNDMGSQQPSPPDMGSDEIPF